MKTKKIDYRLWAVGITVALFFMTYLLQKLSTEPAVETIKTERVYE